MMSDFLNLLVPKRFFKFLTGFLLYVISSSIKNWKGVIIIWVLIILLLLIIDKENINIYTIFSLVSVPFAAATIIQLLEDFSDPIESDKPNFGELECVFISDKDHYEVNFISDKLLEESKQRIKSLPDKISLFGTDLISYKLITRPKFYYYLISPNQLSKSIEKKVAQKGFLLILQITVNIQNLKVDVKFNINREHYNNTKPFQEMEEIFSRIHL